MNQKDIEKAWAKLSMHNSELLLHVARLEKELELLRYPNDRIRKLLSELRYIKRRGLWQTIKDKFTGDYD